MGSKLLPHALLLAFFLPMIAFFRQSAQQDAFTVGEASRLVNQLAEALEGHQPDRFLSAFNLAHMQAGQLFKQQMASFFSHHESIRVHLNLTEATMHGDQGSATVEAEMETGSHDDSTTPVRERGTLHFTAEHSSSGWKLIDVQPRTFFSATSPPAPRR